MKKYLGLAALTTAAALSLTACGGSGAPAASSAPASTGSAGSAGQCGQDHHPVAGGRRHPGRTAQLPEGRVQGQDRRHPHYRGAGLGRPLTKLTTALPDAENTPDVVEIGNTWSPTFTNVGAFMRPQRHVRGARRRQAAAVLRRGRLGRRQELRPAVLLRLALHLLPQGHLDGSRRRGPHDARRVQRDGEAITRRTRATQDLRLLHRRRGLAQRHLVDLRQRRRPREEGRRQVDVDPLRPEHHQGPDPAAGPVHERLQAPRPTPRTAPRGSTSTTPTRSSTRRQADRQASLAAATIIAPGWAHWSIGDLQQDARTGKDVRTWNDDEVRRLRAPG